MSRLLTLVLVILFLGLSPTLLMAGLDEFDNFDQFDRQERGEFNRLINEAQNCINKWDFECAERALKEARRYILSRKDSQKIRQMYARLKEEKERKRRYEEEQRRASEEVYVKIRACEDKGSYTLCILDARDNRGRSEIFTLPIWYKRNPGYYQMYVSYYLANGPICHFYPLTICTIKLIKILSNCFI
jgi:hypothetical protein